MGRQLNQPHWHHYLITSPLSAVSFVDVELLN